MNTPFDAEWLEYDDSERVPERRHTTPAQHNEDQIHRDQQAVIALTELRGWALGGKGGVLNVDNGWLLERIDKALAGFGVLDEIRRIVGDVMEDRAPIGDDAHGGGRRHPG